MPGCSFICESKNIFTDSKLFIVISLSIWQYITGFNNTNDLKLISIKYSVTLKKLSSILLMFL